ncbi:uncharacterized protein LOC128548031 [Mercenaria mercenaria]|uniref:uncharacterized protein LOC128548031 n=1 Tax=Mercenaria mercenaria TaxID=6596 RepID=UPI00234F97F1|nr:uncharacterized protein LOC128548031 [Mercenaria mercenaria]
MKVLLDILLFSWLFVKSILAADFEYSIITMPANWSMAHFVCTLSQHLLLSDPGKDPDMLKIFDDLEPEEFVWINAKNVEIVYNVYTSYASAYLKIAYQPAHSKLTSYICLNAISREVKRFVSSDPLSWSEVKDLCSNSTNWSLYIVSTPGQVRETVALLKKDVPFWIGRMSDDYMIPKFDGQNMIEECLGVMKLSDGTLAYRRDNCTNKHIYVCVSSSVELFAPTITRVTQPFPFIINESKEETSSTSFGISQNSSDTAAPYTSGEPGPKIRTTDLGTSQDVVQSSDDVSMSRGEIWGLVGGSYGAVLILLVVVCVTYYLRRRRKISGRRKDSNMSGSIPLDSCCNNDPMKITESEEENEDGENTTSQSSARNQRPNAKYSSTCDSTAHEKLSEYFSVGGRKAPKVQDCVKTENQPQPLDFVQFDTTIKLLKKTGKSKALDEKLKQCEDTSAGSEGHRCIEGKLLYETCRKTATTKPPVLIFKERPVSI